MRDSVDHCNSRTLCWVVMSVYCIMSCTDVLLLPALLQGRPFIRHLCTKPPRPPPPFLHTASNQKPVVENYDLGKRLGL